MEQEEAVDKVKNHEEIDSPIEMLLENEELFGVLVNAPDRVIDSLVAEHRLDMFEPLWETASYDRHEAIEEVKEAEEYAIETWEAHDKGPDVPEWLLRLEAQHIVTESLLDELNG